MHKERKVNWVDFRTALQQAWAGYKLSSTVMEKLQKVNKNVRENQWSIENTCIITINENTQFDVDVVTVQNNRAARKMGKDAKSRRSLPNYIIE